MYVYIYCLHICVYMYKRIILCTFSCYLLLRCCLAQKWKKGPYSHIHTPALYVCYVLWNSFCLQIFLSLSGLGKEMKCKGIISSPPAEGRKEWRLPWAWAVFAWRTLFFSKFFIPSAWWENVFHQNLCCILRSDS